VYKQQPIVDELACATAVVVAAMCLLGQLSAAQCSVYYHNEYFNEEQAINTNTPHSTHNNCLGALVSANKHPSH
jgi:hypothetical protein